MGVCWWLLIATWVIGLLLFGFAMLYAYIEKKTPTWYQLKGDEPLGYKRKK